MAPSEEAPRPPPSHESLEAERERHRRKLAQWREMGFDVSALEVLLETDIERFRQRRLEMLREQIHPPHPSGAPSPAAAPIIAHPEPTPAAAGAPASSHLPESRPPRPPSAGPVPVHIHREPNPEARRAPHVSEIRYPPARRRGRGRASAPAPRTPIRSIGVVRVGEGRPGVAGAPPEEPPPSVERGPEAAPAAPGDEFERGPGAGEGAGRAEGSVAKVRKVRKVRRTKRPEEARRPSHRPPGPSRKWDLTASASIAVVVVLVLAGVGYVLTHPPEAVTARLSHPESVSAGEEALFDASNSSSTVGSVVWYTWSFGDGGTAAGKSRAVTHSYGAPGTYLVELVVKSDRGKSSAPAKSRITVKPLSVTVPEMRLDDRAYYNVSGAASLTNNDTYLYTIQLPSGAVHVTSVSLEFSGELDQWVWEVTTREDGFKTAHRALHVYSKESLRLDGNATTTSAGTYRIGGNLSYDEDAYSDPASGGVFLVEARARTSLSLSVISLPGSSLESSDSIRSYPGVGGVQEQFQAEKIYRGRRLSQDSPSSLNGSLAAGGAVYSWSFIDVRSVGGRPSLGLHVTMDAASMRKLGLSEFFMDIWLSAGASLPTRSHLHVAGRSGDAFFSSDHISEMREFLRGSGEIDSTPQSFDPSPLPSELFAPFSDVPQAGSGFSSLRFSPAQAVEEARARSPDFNQFLSSNPQAYAVSCKYIEGGLGPQSASWNITFAWPGATTGHYINVTRTALGEYYLKSDWTTSLPTLTTDESSLQMSLTMSSAEALMKSDNETAQRLFKNGSLDFPSVSLSLRADHTYPSLNLVSMYASGERASYAVLVEREGCASAFSMDTGQMLYFYTHSDGLS
ncbi:MAG: PKD domain-containing protein [Thermoplasmatota archaeon]